MRSQGLMRPGRVRLAEARAQTQSIVGDELLLVGHCPGIGAARRAVDIALEFATSGERLLPWGLPPQVGTGRQYHSARGQVGYSSRAQ